MKKVRLPETLWNDIREALEMPETYLNECEENIDKAAEWRVMCSLGLRVALNPSNAWVDKEELSAEEAFRLYEHLAEAKTRTIDLYYSVKKSDENLAAALERFREPVSMVVFLVRKAIIEAANN